MPSTISAALEAHLAGEVVTLALLVKITRKDGTVIGVTGHDQDIVFSGLTYYASDAVSSTALTTTVGTGVDALDLEGVLNNSQILKTNLAAGIYGGAKIEVRLVNYMDLTMGARFLVSGIIGETTDAEQDFKAEVRSLSQLLKQTVGDLTTKGCRACLGDARCKVNMAGNTVGGTAIRATKNVSSVGGPTSITFGSDSAPSDHYRYGTVKFTSGLNAGIPPRPIKAHSLVSGAAVITLRMAFPFTVAPGDTAVLEAGCDKIWTTCGAKFGNANNFHGEPFVPGNDKTMKIGRQ
jgi:uncharacterized phage protein (TIGR02218 family)